MNKYKDYLNEASGNTPEKQYVTNSEKKFQALEMELTRKIKQAVHDIASEGIKLKMAGMSRQDYNNILTSMKNKFKKKLKKSLNTI